jgi:hypothetical protein
MKIRTDFVTNSSSSSFIVAGKHVNIDDIDLGKGKYLLLGRDLCEGQDIVDIDEDILNYLKSHIRYNWGDMYLGDYNISIIKYFVQKYDEDDSVFTIRELKQYINEDEPFEIISLEKDYHGSETVNDLKDYY